MNFLPILPVLYITDFKNSLHFFILLASKLNKMNKHTKLFYLAIARIRVVNKPDGTVFLNRIRQHNFN